MASLDSTLTRSVQEMQRAIKRLETKQGTSKAEARQVTRRLETLEKELWKAVDSHSHEVVTLLDGRKESKVIRRSITISDIAALFQKKA